MTKTAIFVLLAFLAAGLLALLYYFSFFGLSKEIPNRPVADVTSFQECASAGFPVMESYPRKCSSGNGQTFAEDIGNELELLDAIVVGNPRPNQTVLSPLTLDGEARGSWFFEGQGGLVKVVNEEGDILGQGNIIALDDWMREDFIDFTGEIEFDPQGAVSGDLIVENANPSGLPENSKQLRIPVKFQR